jgi:hypothetical protein
MAGTNDGRDDEIDALLGIEDIDTAKITEQITQRKGGKAKEEPPKTDPIKTDPPKTDAPKADPPKADPPKQDAPDINAVRAAVLNEMFGEQFKTVDDVKKANIPASLQELATLRQRNQELETQVKAKPKHSFANDDIAKFNEFVRETGIKDAGVFNRLNATDVANMDPMDALVQQHIIENPSLAGKEPQVRKYFETKYNVDPKKVEAGDLTQEELEVNLIGITSEGAKAKAKLQDLKSKIKMPEIPADEPGAKPKKWTPEIETQQKAGWNTLNEKMVAEFSTIPILLKGSKEPIVNFVVPEETKKGLLSNALDYVVSNQLEVNEANVKNVAQSMYSDLRLTLQDDIIHAVFERARSLTEKEYLETYHNPSKRNTDNPDISGEPLSEDAKKERAFQAEMNR